MERHPHLDRTEATRHLQMEFEQPLPRGHAPGCWVQVFRQRSKGGAMGRRIPDEATANVEGGVQPPVGIKGQRVGLRYFRNEMAMTRSGRDQRADTTIDMQPEILLNRQRSQPSKIV